MRAILITLSIGQEVWTIGASTKQVWDAIEEGREIGVNTIRPVHASAAGDFMPARLNLDHVVAVVAFPPVAA